MRPALFLLLAAILCALNAPAQDIPAPPAAPPQSPVAQAESTPPPPLSPKPTLPALNRRVPKKPAEDARANAALEKDLRDLKQQVQALQEERTAQTLNQIDRNANWVIGLTQIVLAVIVGLITTLLGVAGFLTLHGLRLEKRAKDAVKEIEGDRDKAKKSAEETHELVKRGKDRLRIIEEWKPGVKLDKKTEQAAEAVAKDETAGMFDRLMANALILENEKKWGDALRLWEAIVTLQPNNGRALFGAAYCIGELADLEQDNEKKRELHREECEKYAKAIEADLKRAEAWYNWGATLGQLADLEDDNEKERKLRREACEKYAKAVEADPKDDGAWYNWGNDLGQLADLEEDDEKERELLREACEKYAKAVEADPKKVEAWSNWGVTLGQLADLGEDNEKERELRREACEKYAKAVEADPKNAGAWYNWGDALAKLADLEDDDGKERELLREECEKYAKAVEADPKMVIAWENMSAAFVQLAPQTSEERASLLDQAEQAALKAHELVPGKGVYNLACIAALRGNKEKCREWLEKAVGLQDGLTAAHLEEDTDMGLVREEAWFKELLERQRVREAVAGGEDGKA
jgi:hypothetical protein